MVGDSEIAAELRAGRGCRASCRFIETYSEANRAAYEYGFRKKTSNVLVSAIPPLARTIASALDFHSANSAARGSHCARSGGRSITKFSSEASMSIDMAPLFQS
jgi:hypothetical protein